MKSLIKILIRYADSFFGPANVFLASAGDIIGFPAAGDEVRLLLAAPVSMPDGLHGSQFIIKASFPKHIGGEQRFSSQPAFTMPYTAEDLAAAVGKKENESKTHEIERLRKEAEQLTSRPTPGK
jgi:hypothetical protein